MILKLLIEKSQFSMNSQIYEISLNLFAHKMISFILLLSFCFCEPTSDLIPPFYPNEKNRVGYWDVGGASVVYEDYIIMLPPIQNHKGSIWNSLPIPFGEWLIDIELNLSAIDVPNKSKNKISGYGGFSIWLIDSYGADGTLLGGPERFHGVSIPCFIETGSSQFPLFQFGLFQSNGTSSFNSDQILSNCTTTFQPKSSQFRLRIHVQKDFISISDDSQNFIINNSLNVDLSKAWLGLTTMSGERSTQLDLLSAKFKVFHPIFNRQPNKNANFQYLHKQDPHVNKVLSSVLRNPSFSLMKQEITNLTATKGVVDPKNSISNLIDVLVACDEINEVVSQTATYAQLNDFIRNTMIPYTQGWQKRTFKIIDGVEKAKLMLTEAFNQTKAMIYIFNNSIVEMTTKTDKKIVKLSDLLTNETQEQDLQDKEKLNEYLKQPFWVNLLRIISVIEIIVVFFCYIKQRKIDV